MELYMGNCMDILPYIPAGSIDLVLTDPPYGIDYHSQHRKKANKFAKIAGDKKPHVEFVGALKRVVSNAGAVMIFTRWDVQQIFMDAMAAAGMPPRSMIIWDKCVHGMGDLRRAYGRRYESIIFWSADRFSFPGMRPSDIVSCPRVSPNKLLHPNEKPVQLLEKLILQTTRPGAMVLDCFMGSGTTGIACKNMGRNFIGLEIDKEYFALASERISNACGAQVGLKCAACPQCVDDDEALYCGRKS